MCKFLARASFAWLGIFGCTTAAEPIVVGSKNFPESYILGELIAQLLETNGFEVERKMNLAGTKVCFDALVAGEIHVYPEYTGTIQAVILESDQNLTYEELNQQLNQDRTRLLEPFGFNNSYALATNAEVAESRNLKTVSDLVAHPDLRLQVSHEFISREDGWAGLQPLYGLQQQPVGIDHTLAYRGLANGDFDLTDAYTTDGEIAHFGLVLLEDDKEFFPKYLGAPIVNQDLPQSAIEVINLAAGTLPDSRMTELNSNVMITGLSAATVAKQHLQSIGVDSQFEEQSDVEQLLSLTVQHLFLTFTALSAATVLGLAIAFGVYRHVRLSRPVVYSVSLLQTIPSLALLALMIPLLGTGVVPAIVALFLYALLPIVRNTVTSLNSTDPQLLRVAQGLGLKRWEILRLVELPLAMPAIVAGIRTSAVICIGTATLAAYIGAGGLGDLIVRGLSLDDTGLILQGAIAASVLAIVVELTLEAVEAVVTPPHLKLLKSPLG